MRQIKQSQSARGSNRGGCGGGYEQTDPDYELKRIRRMRDEYLSLNLDSWKRQYLNGLSKGDREALNRLLHPERE